MPEQNKTRGGARPGAGRKPLSPEQRAANKRRDNARRAALRKTIELTAEDMAAVEACAKIAGVSVHAWMVAAVRSALQK